MDFTPRTTTPSPEPEAPEAPEASPPESASEAISIEAGAEAEAILEIDLGDAPAEDTAEPSAALPGMTADGLLTRDAFYQSAAGCLNLAAQFSRLESLAVAPAEEAAARPAADALYDTALEVPWLRFLIEPSNKWVQRSLVVFAFAAPKALAVRAEVEARKAEAAKARAQQSARSKPANDNGGDIGNPRPAANDNKPDPLSDFPKDAPGHG